MGNLYQEAFETPDETGLTFDQQMITKAFLVLGDQRLAEFEAAVPQELRAPAINVMADSFVEPAYHAGVRDRERVEAGQQALGWHGFYGWRDEGGL